jgi:hypothetical protein
MIEISTYFRVSDNFIAMENYTGSFNDIDYIEGAIILSVNNVLVSSLETWDYVDQLWGYIINGLDEIASGQNFFTYFPDQPIGLAFEIVGKEMIKVSTDYDGGKTSVISKNIFISVLSTKGREFFKKMLVLVPSHKDTWIHYLEKIEKIESQVAR